MKSSSKGLQLNTNNVKRDLLFFGVGLLVSAEVMAIPAGPQVLIKEIESRYPNARVEILQNVDGNTQKELQGAFLESVHEPSRGVLAFRTVGQMIDSQVRFAAWVPILIAKRRIAPYEKLTRELFDRREVDIARGLFFEIRSMLVGVDNNVSALQAKQTILEGQPLLMNAIERKPDVKSGQMVTVHVHSGNLILTSQAIAQETGFAGSQIKILTKTTKKEMTGTLKSAGVVEVEL